MIAKVQTIEPGDIVNPTRVGNMVVTHTTRDGKGRYVLRMEMEVHYNNPDELVELVRKVGT